MVTACLAAPHLAHIAERVERPVLATAAALSWRGQRTRRGVGCELLEAEPRERMSRSPDGYCTL